MLSFVCALGLVATEARAQNEPQSDVATFVLANKELAPAAIGVDDKSVYWIANYRSAINKVSKGGGAVTTLVDYQNGIRRMIVDKGFIYFLTNDDIRRVPTAGGKATILVKFADVGASESVYWYIALDNQNVYFVSGPASRQQIFKVGKGGGKPQALVRVGIPSGLTADGVNVYWVEYAEGMVKKVPVAGGASVEVGKCERAGAGALIVDSTNVYCAEAEGKVLRLAKSNGAAETIANVEQASFDQLAVDERSVYALSLLKGIYRIDKSGGPPLRLVFLDRVAAHFAIDDKNLYWSNYDEGTVSRRPK